MSQTTNSHYVTF